MSDSSGAPSGDAQGIQAARLYLPAARTERMGTSRSQFSPGRLRATCSSGSGGESARSLIDQLILLIPTIIVLSPMVVALSGSEFQVTQSPRCHQADPVTGRLVGTPVPGGIAAFNGRCSGWLLTAIRLCCILGDPGGLQRGPLVVARRNLRAADPAWRSAGSATAHGRLGRAFLRYLGYLVSGSGCVSASSGRPSTPASRAGTTRSPGRTWPAARASAEHEVRRRHFFGRRDPSPDGPDRRYSRCP